MSFTLTEVVVMLNSKRHSQRVFGLLSFKLDFFRPKCQKDTSIEAAPYSDGKAIQYRSSRVAMSSSLCLTGGLSVLVQGNMLWTPGHSVCGDL